MCQKSWCWFGLFLSICQRSAWESLPRSNINVKYLFLCFFYSFFSLLFLSLFLMKKEQNPWRNTTHFQNLFREMSIRKEMREEREPWENLMVCGIEWRLFLALQLFGPTFWPNSWPTGLIGHFNCLKLPSCFFFLLPSVSAADSSLNGFVQDPSLPSCKISFFLCYLLLSLSHSLMMNVSDPFSIELTADRGMERPCSTTWRALSVPWMEGAMPLLVRKLSLPTNTFVHWHHTHKVCLLK